MHAPDLIRPTDRPTDRPAGRHLAVCDRRAATYPRDVSTGSGSGRPRSELEALEDWALLRIVAAGDRRAGDIFIRRHSPLMSRFFRNKVNNLEDANELVGETVMACVEAGGRVEPRGPFQPYLFGIALKVLRRYLRSQYKRKRERDDFDDLCVGDRTGSPSAALARKSETRLLVRALRRIPLKYQLVLEMQFFEEMSGPQIAALLGIPLPTVYTYQSRGRKRLHEVISALAEDPSQAQSTMMGIQTWAKDIRARLTPSAPGSGSAR